jgi:hypothetical protein
VDGSDRFASGHNDRLLGKVSGADAVILDREDAVPPEHKAAARTRTLQPTSTPLQNLLTPAPSEPALDRAVTTCCRPTVPENPTPSRIDESAPNPVPFC